MINRDVQLPVGQAYRSIYEATPWQRIGLIRARLSARDAKCLLDDLAAPGRQIFAALNVSPAAIKRKAAKDLVLSQDESERILGVATLVGHVQAIISSDEAFDAAVWLAKWLIEPLPALGGQAPASLIDTFEGRQVVSTLLEQMRSGAYA